MILRSIFNNSIHSLDSSSGTEYGAAGSYSVIMTALTVTPWHLLDHSTTHLLLPNWNPTELEGPGQWASQISSNPQSERSFFCPILCLSCWQCRKLCKKRATKFKSTIRKRAAVLPPAANSDSAFTSSEEKSIERSSDAGRMVESWPNRVLRTHTSTLKPIPQQQPPFLSTPTVRQRSQWVPRAKY